MEEAQLVEESEGAVSLFSGERRVWTYNYVPVEVGQPCFHPLNTPAGHTISLLAPWDHVHHCALWFAWKLIDGVNAWEGPAYGPKEPRILLESFRTADTGFSAAYRWQKLDGTQLLMGQTTCEWRSLGDEAYVLDLGYRFQTPGNDAVLLDRNHPPSPGYAGLSVRLIRPFCKGVYLDAEGRTEPLPGGTRTAWHTYAGPIDGAPNLRGGVALMDHPTNPRHPTPTYCIRDGGDFAFLQCSFLWEEPYLLAPESPLKLRYRVVVYDGEPNQTGLSAAFDDFCGKRGQ